MQSAGSNSPKHAALLRVPSCHNVAPSRHATRSAVACPACTFSEAATAVDRPEAICRPTTAAHSIKQQLPTLKPCSPYTRR